MNKTVAQEIAEEAEMNKPETTAIKAIRHILSRIETSPEVGYYMGWGTESFSLLARAYGEHTGKTEDEVQEEFAPKAARDPRKELQGRIEDLERQLSGSHVFHAPKSEPCFGARHLTADEFVAAVQAALLLRSHNPEQCLREISTLFEAVDLPINLLSA